MTSTFKYPAISNEGGLSVYLDQIKKFPMLDAEEEYMLAKNWKTTGNVKSAEKLVTSHLRLVAKIAMRYKGYGLPMNEIISEGNVGLMQAVKKFEPEKGFRLATYAMWWIKASIQEYILRSWSLVKIGTTTAQKKLFFNLKKLKNQIPTSNTFHCYLNPQRKVSEEAKKVHGYTDEFLSDKKLFKDIANDFLDFIKDKKIIIHNAEFDLSHINNELKLIGKPPISNDNVIDTLEIARDKYPGSQSSLDALCKRFRIDNSRRKLHTALIDCELLSKVYVNLIDQKEPTLSFESSSKINEKINEEIDYCKRVILPNDNELKEHQLFLNKFLKKNFF